MFSTTHITSHFELQPPSPHSQTHKPFTKIGVHNLKQYASINTITTNEQYRYNMYEAAGEFIRVKKNG